MYFTKYKILFLPLALTTSLMMKTGVYAEHQHFSACIQRVSDDHANNTGGGIRRKVSNYSNVITGSPKGTKSRTTAFVSTLSLARVASMASVASKAAKSSKS